DDALREQMRDVRPLSVEDLGDLIGRAAHQGCVRVGPHDPKVAEAHDLTYREVEPRHVRGAFAGKGVEYVPDRHRHALTVRYVDPRVSPLDKLGSEGRCDPSYPQNNIQGGSMK